MRLMREDEHEPIQKGPWKRTERTPEQVLKQMAAQLKEGKSESQVAEDFNVSRSTVQRAKKLYGSTGVAERAASSAPEVVAGGTPVDEPLAGVETGQGIKDWLL